MKITKKLKVVFSGSLIASLLMGQIIFAETSLDQKSVSPIQEQQSYATPATWSLPVPTYNQQPHDSICWATCASMLVSYFKNEWVDRKVEIAKRVHGDNFNKAGYMRNVTDNVNHYTNRSYNFHANLPVNDVLNNIKNRKKPIVTFIRWKDGNGNFTQVGHALVIRGFEQKTNSQNYQVNDPWDGRMHIYDSNYYTNNNKFAWTDSTTYN